MQRWAENLSLADFVKYIGLSGAFGGVVGGGISGLGVLSPVFGNGATTGLSLLGAGASVWDIGANGLNWCNLLGLTSSAIGLTGGRNIPGPPMNPSPQFAYAGDYGGSGVVAYASSGVISVPLEVGLSSIFGNVAMFASAGGQGNDGDERPIGFTEEEWQRFKEDARQFLQDTGLDELGGELEVQASRVPSKGSPVNNDTDLDIIYRISPERFQQLVRDYLTHVPNPPNNHIRIIGQERMSIDIIGSRTWGRFNTDGSFFKDLFYGRWVDSYIQSNFGSIDFSIVPSGTAFDQGPFIRIYPR